eukprot:g5786.t1
MPFGQPRLILSLAPSQIDAALVVGKRVRATKRAKLSPAVWEEAWGEGLSPYDMTLTSLLRSLGAPKDVRTRVLYTSPGAISDVKHALSEGEDGVNAARLEVLENIANSGVEYISGATRLAHENGASVLITADRDLNAQAIFAWLSRCGCRLEALVPTRAIALRSVIRDVTSREDDGSVTCYLGERTTVIASGGSGTLESIRTIDFGFSLLVEAFARGLRQDVEEGGDAEICTNHTEARERLFEVGLPTGGAKSKGAQLSRKVMPLLQPVLQRYCIEIKQTIRFGVPQTSSTGRTLRLIGPGAAIQGFLEPLRESIDNEVSVEPKWAKFDPDAVCPELSLEQDYIEDDAPELRLVPRIVSEQNAARLIAAGVRIGVLCAGLLLAGEFGYLYKQRADTASTLRVQEPVLARVRDHRAQTELANSLSHSLDTAATMTVGRLAERPDWFAVMAELAALRSDEVRFNDVRGFREDGAVRIAIEGWAAVGGEAGGSLSTLIEQLRVSPLFIDVQLGSTSLVEIDGARAKRFALRLTPRLFAPRAPGFGSGEDLRAEVQRAGLAAATAEIEAGQAQIVASQQEPREVIQELREQAESLRRFWSISADASVLYEEIDAVAKRYGVVVERVEPSRGGSKGAIGDEQEDAPAFNEIGYSIELVGSYEGVARFLRAIQNELGMARIDSVRITPALSIDQATQARAMHLGAVVAPVLAVALIRFAGPQQASAKSAAPTFEAPALEARVPSGFMGEGVLGAAALHAQKLFNAGITGTPFPPPETQDRETDITQDLMTRPSEASVGNVIEAPSLRVSAIMSRRQGAIAVINARICTVGTRLAPGWTLDTIDDKRRTLTLAHASGRRVELSLGTP